MAKIRPVRAGARKQSKKEQAKSWVKGLPCLVVVLGVFVILTLLLTSMLSSGVK